MGLLKKVAVTFVVLVGLLWTTSGCKTNDNKKPYRLSEDSLIFNTIHQSDSFKKTIYCINNSDNEIKIVKIATGCGCTSTILKDSIVKTNDSVPIYIKYLPLINKDSGLVTKYITIRTNSNPVFTNIKIKGEVIK